MADRPRLTVLGTGYLGITHAVCMASEVSRSLGSTSTPIRSPG